MDMRQQNEKKKKACCLNMNLWVRLTPKKLFPHPFFAAANVIFHYFILYATQWMFILKLRITSAILGAWATFHYPLYQNWTVSSETILTVSKFVAFFFNPKKCFHVDFVRLTNWSQLIGFALLMVFDIFFIVAVHFRTYVHYVRTLCVVWMLIIQKQNYNFIFYQKHFLCLSLRFFCLFLLLLLLLCVWPVACCCTTFFFSKQHYNNNMILKCIPITNSNIITILRCEGNYYCFCISFFLQNNNLQKFVLILFCMEKRKNERQFFSLLRYKNG